MSEDRVKLEWVNILLDCIDKCETSEQRDRYHREIIKVLNPPVRIDNDQ